ncbi:hypothetical protein OMCYN_01541 [cyanobiont of Ornithocercus magnificus]|nr:hypothetical protein OMCYN_01541 [cyanobiont of Ornithocercus magnificus]
MAAKWHMISLLKQAQRLTPPLRRSCGLLSCKFLSSAGERLVKNFLRNGNLLQQKLLLGFFCLYCNQLSLDTSLNHIVSLVFAGVSFSKHSFVYFSVGFEP